jgi:FkbM family methyltransferase
MSMFFKPLHRLATSVGKRLAPRTYACLKFQAFGRRYPEPELHLLPCLCDPRKTSLDVGASAGLYMAHLLRLSERCIAFEARPQQAAELKSVLKRIKARASVEAVALSDRVGQAKLRMLVCDPGRATIEPSNLLDDEEDSSDRAELIVPMRRLDDYGLDNVGFVKVDVEGHELAVLKGGAQTIRQNQPSLLIEIEERHSENAVGEVIEFITALGYSGFFLQGQQARPVSEFDPARHQDSRNIGGWKSHWRRTGVYINNFIFVPSERAQEFLAMASLLKSHSPDDAN